MRFQFSCVIVVFVLKTDAINLLLSLKGGKKSEKCRGNEWHQAVQSETEKG